MSGNTPPPGQGGWGEPGQGQPGSGSWGQPGQPGAGQPSQGQPGAGQPGAGGWGQPQQPGAHGGGWGQQPPDYAQWGPGAPSGPPPDVSEQTSGGGGGGRRGLKAAVLGVAMVVLLGGGAFAFYQADPFNLFRSGPQAAEALPADALFYVGVDLDPSAKQKVNALRFLQHFPEFSDVTGVQDARDDVRKSIVEEALKDSDCADVTYDDDIEPWIGSKFGAAGVPAAGGGDVDAMFVLETSDHDAAETALKALAKCAGEDSFGTAPVGDYVLIAETQKLADRFASDAEQSSLADSEAFADDMDALGDLGLATMWVNVDKAMEAAGSEGMLGSDEELAAAAFERAAATFRFEPDSAEIVSVAYGDLPDVEPGDNAVVDLPESTALAISVSGGEKSLLDAWDTILESARADGLDVEQGIADFETQTGLTLPDDLATVLGDNLLFAVDADGVSAEALEAEDPSLLNLGLRMTNDPAELNAIYDKILGAFEDELGAEMPFSKQDAEDGIVIASNDEYAGTLADMDGNLGDSDAFRSVIDDAASQQAVAFFNWDSIEPAIIESMESSGASANVIENVRALQAFGWSVGVDGDYATSSFQMSVD